MSRFLDCTGTSEAASAWREAKEKMVNNKNSAKAAGNYLLSSPLFREAAGYLSTLASTSVSSFITEISESNIMQSSRLVASYAAMALTASDEMKIALFTFIAYKLKDKLNQRLEASREIKHWLDIIGSGLRQSELSPEGSDKELFRQIELSRNYVQSAIKKLDRIRDRVDTMQRTWTVKEGNTNAPVIFPKKLWDDASKDVKLAIDILGNDEVARQLIKTLVYGDEEERSVAKKKLQAKIDEKFLDFKRRRSIIYDQITEGIKQIAYRLPFPVPATLDVGSTESLQNITSGGARLNLKGVVLISPLIQTLGNNLLKLDVNYDNLRKLANALVSYISKPKADLVKVRDDMTNELDIASESGLKGLDYYSVSFKKPKWAGQLSGTYNLYFNGLFSGNLISQLSGQQASLAQDYVSIERVKDFLADESLWNPLAYDGFIAKFVPSIPKVLISAVTGKLDPISIANIGDLKRKVEGSIRMDTELINLIENINISDNPLMKKALEALERTMNSSAAVGLTSIANAVGSGDLENFIEDITTGIEGLDGLAFVGTNKIKDFIDCLNVNSTQDPETTVPGNINAIQPRIEDKFQLAEEADKRDEKAFEGFMFLFEQASNSFKGKQNTGSVPEELIDSEDLYE